MVRIARRPPQPPQYNNLLYAFAADPAPLNKPEKAPDVLFRKIGISSDIDNYLTVVIEVPMNGVISEVANMRDSMENLRAEFQWGSHKDEPEIKHAYEALSLMINRTWQQQDYLHGMQVQGHRLAMSDREKTDYFDDHNTPAEATEQASPKSGRSRRRKRQVLGAIAIGIGISNQYQLTELKSAMSGTKGAIQKQAVKLAKMQTTIGRLTAESEDMRGEIDVIRKEMLKRNYTIQALAAMGIFSPWMDTADHIITVLHDIIEEAFKGKISSSMLGKRALEHIWRTVKAHAHKHDNTVLIDGMKDILSLQVDAILDYDHITLFVYVPVLDQDLAGAFEVFQLIQAVLPTPNKTEIDFTSPQQIIFLDRTNADRYKTLTLPEIEKCRIVGTQNFYACQRNNGELRIDIVRPNSS